MLKMFGYRIRAFFLCLSTKKFKRLDIEIRLLIFKILNIKLLNLKTKLQKVSN
jgi:hypothetical protein